MSSQRRCTGLTCARAKSAAPTFALQLQSARVRQGIGAQGLGLPPVPPLPSTLCFPLTKPGGETGLGVKTPAAPATAPWTDHDPRSAVTLQTQPGGREPKVVKPLLRIQCWQFYDCASKLRRLPHSENTAEFNGAKSFHSPRYFACTLITGVEAGPEKHGRIINAQ